MDLNFNKILKKGVNSILIQAISIGLIFILNWFLTNRLGAKNYGLLTYSFSWVYLFGSISCLGLNSLLQRELSRYKNDQQGKLIGLIRFSSSVSFLTTTFIVIVFEIFIYLWFPLHGNLYTALSIAILALPFYGLILIQKSANVGLKKVEISLIPENILRPALFFALILMYFNHTDNVLFVVSLNAVAFFGGFLISSFLLKVSIPKKTLPPVFASKKWIKQGITFLFITAIVTVNSKADIIMLGLFGQIEQAGIYNIVVKLSQFIGLSLLIMNTIFSPYLSEFFTLKKRELSITIKRTIRLIFIIALAVLLVFILKGSELLNFFGTNFNTGYFSLILLSIGQVINIMFGPVGNLLNMNNYERYTLKGMLFSALINISLNVILIPLFGMQGAAIGTFSSLVFWNVYLFFIVKSKLKFNPSIF